MIATPAVRVYPTPVANMLMSAQARGRSLRRKHPPLHAWLALAS